MKTKTSRKDIVLLISILSKLVTSSARDFSHEISQHNHPALRRFSEYSDFEHIFYKICVYLGCSFIEQTISTTIASEALMESLLAYNHRESYMSNISQAELSADLAFIADLERSLVKTPVMSDSEYYNELFRFAILTANQDEPSERAVVNILSLADLDIGKTIESWVAKVINEISIAYNSAMTFIPHKKKKDMIRNTEILAAAAILLIVLIRFLIGIASDAREQKRDDFSDAYVQGYNAGAIEGARCGIDWAYESLGKPVPDVDYEDIISEYSFYSFPLDEYYE